MKKIIILFINIFIIVGLLFIFNIIITFYENINYNKNNETVKFQITKIWNFITRKIDKNEAYNILVKDDNHFYRDVVNPNSKNVKPIVIFGCSYAYGSDLLENQIFSYKLGTLTNRTVYNRALGGLGIQHMLYQLKNEDFYKIIPHPECIIYVFIWSHYTRMFTPVCVFCEPSYTVFYKQNRKKEFIEKKRGFFTNRVIFQHSLMNNFVYPKLIENSFYQKYLDNLLVDYLKESKKEADRHWKDTKFVVFMFDKPPPIMLRL